MSSRFGSPTPYDTDESRRRKRKRFLSRSDEEIREEMDKTRLSYRAGWPTLPPLPLETLLDNAKDMVQNANEHLRVVESIVMAQRISNSRFFFAFRVPRDAEDTDDEQSLSRFLTLLFTADMTADSHKIENTIIQIRSKFRGHSETDNVNIECVDFRAIGSLSSYPIYHHERLIIRNWDAVASIVLQILKKHEWLSVELLRRGFISDVKRCPPTIVITTPTAGDRKWYQEIVPLISSNIATLAPDFDIEILCGTTLWGSRRYRPSEYVDGTAYTQSVRMGSSIGIHNDDRGAGTLGGPVILEGGNECAITSWHVVRDERLDKIVAKSKDGALEINNKTLKASPQNILSPATCDHHGYMGTLQDLIKDYSKDAANGDEYAKVAFKERNAEYMRLEKMPRVLGNVIAGSGRRTVSVHKYATDKKTGKGKQNAKDDEPKFLFPLDWALIKISNTERRKAINRLPNKRLPTTPTTQLVQDKMCRQWTSFDVEQETVRVAKYGRTTGWTLGEINSCLLYINPTTDRQIADAYGFTSTSPGRCYGVTNRIASEDFLQRGDSGSILVHDGSGTQLGLLYGVTDAGQGMMIPLDVVFQDIKTVTGKRVVNPPYVDPPVVGLAKF